VVNLEGQDLWDQLVPLVNQVPLDSRATQVFLVHQVQLARHPKEFLVLKVPLDFQVREAKMVSLVRLVHLVNQVHQDRWSTTMTRACQSSPMRL